jgi:hypothetical protein
MNRRSLLILLFFCSILLNAYAQERDLYIVNVKAKVVCIDNEEPVPYAHVINNRVHGGTTTNADGFFSMQMLTEDTLIIRSVGYVDYKFVLPDFPPKDLYTIRVTPVKILLDEVTVTEKNKLREKLGLPESKSLDVPIELRGANYNEKPPLLAAVVTPLSYMHYYLSSDEKNKRILLQTIKDDKQWSTFRTYHNLETITRLTGLTGDEADKFLMYCNINNRLPYYASQMEIEFQILNLYYKYQKENSDPAPKQESEVDSTKVDKPKSNIFKK